MFGTVLDVAIGLVLMYTLLSLICSTINEGISSLLALRAATLKGALNNLLGDDFAQQVFDHQLVKGLVQKNRLPWKRRPSYIPSRTFVLTVLDSLGQANGSGFPTTVAEVRAGVEKIGAVNPRVGRALMALVDEANGDLEKFKENVTNWFDSSMQRVSGWYRRQVETIILVIALLVSFVAGIDSILVAKTLWSNPALRAMAIAAAEKAVTDPPPGLPPQGSVQPAARSIEQVSEDMKTLQTQLDSLELPRVPYVWGENFVDWLKAHLLGFVITAAALSLGAPFWFDLLNKLVSLRSSGQKPKAETPQVAKT